MAFRDVERRRAKPSAEPKMALAASAAGRSEQSTPPPQYDAPGGTADFDSEDLKLKWNARIAEEYDGLKDYWGRFFVLEPTSVAGASRTDAVRWAGDPAEPNFCFDVRVAQQLSDWRLKSGHPLHSAFSSRGRRETHNEYLEYRIIFAPDPVDPEKKPPRARRVVFTTELREYWITLAVHAPHRVAAACKEILGRDVAWHELYGPGVTDPAALSEDDRRRAFATWVAGGADDQQLLQAGVPGHPIGPLNNENALFMTHRINGLDDLLYIVLYGAHPYAKREGNAWIPAAKDEVFSGKYFEGEEEAPIQLACRHADPAAAMGAAAQAFDGRQIAFANPLGMYILGFSEAEFRFQNAAVPAEWIRYSRGSGSKLYQRLEFGPPDDSPYYLDDIIVGDDDAPLNGGFQIAERIEVGPWLAVGNPSTVTDEEYEKFKVDPLPAPYSCADADVCRRLGRLKDEYDEALVAGGEI